MQAVFKQITSILLLLAFAIQTFSGGFVVLNYYTNTAAFAKNCVNKAKPKMHCNGKCQMMKKLKEEEEKKDQQLPERKVENKIEVLSSKSFFYSAATAFSVIASKATTVEKDYPLTDISYSFFRPPQV
ncbi:MAG: hypothetical protein RIS73_504 [Bacteroidota bacterium]